IPWRTSHGKGRAGSGSRAGRGTGGHVHAGSEEADSMRAARGGRRAESPALPDAAVSTSEISPAPRRPSAGLSHSQAALLMVAGAWWSAVTAGRQWEHARVFEVPCGRGAFPVRAMAALLAADRGPPLRVRLRAGGAALWISGACWGVMFTAYMVALTLTTVAN